MLVVHEDVHAVERALRARKLRCPGCEAALRGWGRARRRVIRVGRARAWLHPRRTRCSGCAVTHVLLPSSVLLRRSDAVDAIGAALLASAAGQGPGRIAGWLGVPAQTVRNWLRRFATRFELLRIEATRAALIMDPSLFRIEPRGSPILDAIEALEVCAAAGERRFGGGPTTVWRLASAITSGALLAR